MDARRVGTTSGNSEWGEQHLRCVQRYTKTKVIVSQYTHFGTRTRDTVSFSLLHITLASENTKYHNDFNNLALNTCICVTREICIDPLLRGSLERRATRHDSIPIVIRKRADRKVILVMCADG